MIVSARVFLILCVPLLVPGAPTSTPDSHSGSLSSSINVPLKDMPWPPTDYNFVGGLLPLPGQAPAQGSHQPNTKLPKYPMPRIIPVILEVQATGTFPIGTYYRVSQSPSIKCFLQKTVRTEKDRVVITPQGETFLIPKGSKIEISNDGHTHTPDSDSKIQKVDQNNVVKVEKFCKDIHDGTTPEPGLEPFDVYVLRCSNINFWNIGLPEFVKVPVKRKKLGLIIHCILPYGTLYRIPPSGRNNVLASGPALTQEERIARTPQDEVILLPEGTLVSTSNNPDEIYVPTDDTEIRRVSKHDELGIQEWCHKIHSRARAPSGWQREAVRTYVVRCTGTNYWRINSGNFVVVPVYAYPSRKRPGRQRQVERPRYQPYLAVGAHK